MLVSDATRHVIRTELERISTVTHACILESDLCDFITQNAKPVGELCKVHLAGHRIELEIDFLGIKLFRVLLL